MGQFARFHGDGNRRAPLQGDVGVLLQRRTRLGPPLLPRGFLHDRRNQFGFQFERIDLTAMLAAEVEHDTRGIVIQATLQLSGRKMPEHAEVVGGYGAIGVGKQNRAVDLLFRAMANGDFPDAAINTEHLRCAVFVAGAKEVAILQTNANFERAERATHRPAAGNSGLLQQPLQTLAFSKRRAIHFGDLLAEFLTVAQ